MPRTLELAPPNAGEGTVETQMQLAKEAIARFENERRLLIEAVRTEERLLSEKPAEKLAAILRMMLLPDPRAPHVEPRKTLPATEAEKYIELDADYRGFLQNVRTALHARMKHETDVEVARMEAEVRIACVKVLSGVR